MQLPDDTVTDVFNFLDTFAFYPLGFKWTYDSESKLSYRTTLDDAEKSKFVAITKTDKDISGFSFFVVTWYKVTSDDKTFWPKGFTGVVSLFFKVSTYHW